MFTTLLKSLKKVFLKPKVAPLPGSLWLPDDTRVIVTLPDGSKAPGVFRGPSPNGNYAVMLDSEPGRLRSIEFMDLELEAKG